MAPVWTSEQKKVIELHDRNILVSAAAGSGKTAVLVERIINMISNEEKPVDIDRLVVVTFTNAAAFEMKQRILDAIEKKLENEPYNIHLQRQQNLINHAQITTIDSFCLNIIRSYFSEIHLDPGFKVADEGEIKLLMADVMDEMIEDYYKEGRQDFYDFVDCYTPEKTDAKLSDYIMKLYEAAQSNPWPKEWLLNCRDNYVVTGASDISKSEAYKFIVRELHKQIESIKAIQSDMKKIASAPGGPYMYLDALNDDIMFVESLDLLEKPDEVAKRIEEHSFARLSSKKDTSVDESLKETVKLMRDKVKNVLSGIKKTYLNEDLIMFKSQLEQCFPYISLYIDMTIDFMERLDEKKRQKNIIYFSDMEHLALSILVRKEGGDLKYTSVADELSRKYEEILIDEYQDSNLVQEIILNSVSRERFGNPNVFMVGDVKQSIYRFRLAKPDLFINKYDTYSEEDGSYQKIELHKNFRSRESVLSSVNAVFEKIMRKDFGRVEYNDTVKLYAGGEYPPCEHDIGKTEVMILDLENTAAYTDTETQALLCASKIAQIVGNDEYCCLDKKTGTYRQIRYSDIVILMRSAKQEAPIISNMLALKGIPSITESTSGYFDAYEVSILLNLLNIIDNPIQDIPLVSVLKSYFGGFTSTELAQIKADSDKDNFYDAFFECGTDKCKRFTGFLDEMRNQAKYKAIHELIWDIVYNTGYYDYVRTMPSGDERQANIDMLIEKAKAYEKTSYQGLFNFIRYIERLKSYDVDYGEASLINENDDAVRIMTIHKSKGLEFPVVFLLNAHKKFNNSDIGSKIVIDEDLGVGMDVMKLISRTKKTTFVKKAIQTKIRLANLSEEQRILYVALTRAKEKLYITGCVKNSADKISEWAADGQRNELTYLDVTGHASYLDMIMPQALNSDNFAVFTIMDEAFCNLCDNIKIVQKTVNENVVREENSVTMEYKYPYPIVSMPFKVTVSELKHLGQNIDDENSKKLIEEEFNPTVPAFVTGKVKIEGAARGSAYHKFMELMDFTCQNADELSKHLDRCVEAGLISEEWSQAIDIEDFVKLLSSDFGRNLKKAAEEGRLYRERQFVMEIPADDVSDEYPKEEMILVQGVIDVYYETDDGIVLSDYKTDNVAYGSAGRETLLERYHRQLDYYALALSRLTGKKVIKKSIYSFKLGEEIICE